MGDRLDHVVIVGAGLAGLRAAERLRTQGFAGFITMIGDEDHGPYNRPPLSKQLLTHKLRTDDLRFQTFSRMCVMLRTGQRVENLDAANRRVGLASGEQVSYEGLIVATGTRARALPGAPQHDDRVGVLRTLADSRAFERRLDGARHIAIVGGGFIGCEVAASLRERGISVTLVDVAPVLLQRVLGRELGEVLTEVHRRAGVDLRLGAGIATWRTTRSEVRLELLDGSTVAADAVLVAVGTAPSVDWLDGSGADTSDGVLCDATCHVVGLDDVVAAGDVARWPNLRFGSQARRVEHWINAIEMGQAAADSLLRGPFDAGAFMPLPRFWSEQHGIRIQSVGMPGIADRIEVVEGDLGRRTFVAACFEQGRMVGAIGFDSPRSMLRFADLVAASTSFDLRHGSDPPLPRLVPTRLAAAASDGR